MQTRPKSGCPGDELTVCMSIIGEIVMFDEAAWRVEETAEFICERRYAAVALQLPDELLYHAADLSSALNKSCAAKGHAAQVGRRRRRRRCRRSRLAPAATPAEVPPFQNMQIYILADTTYNSLSVDEVAAAHIGADCIVSCRQAGLGCCHAELLASTELLSISTRLT